ncbi:MAG: DNA/RNA nuclease SfsA [Desulfurococcales archaeon]|nr:DNA/RNA nuclease SfsA [Desulfurococcales archaeon]
MEFSGEGLFLSRLNRFTVLIDTGGEKLKCHLHDTGRIDHVLAPGRSAVLYRSVVGRLGRATQCDVVAGIDPSGVVVVLDSRVPNALFSKAYREVLGDPDAELIREPTLQGARLDFLVSGSQGLWAVEVKGVNLSDGGVGRFPNAPSQRALRHLEVLARLAREGVRPAMIFVALRGDINVFAPHRRVDQRFASLACSLRGVVGMIGVRVRIEIEEENRGGYVCVNYEGTAPFTCI